MLQIKTDMIDWERLAGITELAVGKHEGFGAGMCAMEAISYIVREPWSDRPACVSPVIATFMRIWNDYLPDEDRSRVLLPLIPRVVGTAADPRTETRRARLVAKWFASVYAPRWSRSLGLMELVNSLAALPVPLDASTCGVFDGALELAGLREGLRDDEFYDPLLLVRFFFQGSLVVVCNDSVAAALSGTELEAWEAFLYQVQAVLVGRVWDRVAEEAGLGVDVEDEYVDAIDAIAMVVERGLQGQAVELIEKLIDLGIDTTDDGCVAGHTTDADPHSPMTQPLDGCRLVDA